MNAVSQAEFARLLGVAKSWITRLKSEGRLVMTPEGKVDVDASRARLLETAGGERDDVAARWAAQRQQAMNPQSPGQSREGDDAPDSDETLPPGIPSKATSAAKKEFYAALQAELEYRRSIGAVVEKTDVAKAVADIVTTFRQGLEQMPYRTAPELVGKDLDAIRAVLKQDTHGFLADMEREFTQRLQSMGVEEA